MHSAIKEITISVIYWTFVVVFVVTVRFVGIDFIFEVPVNMATIQYIC